MTNTLIGRSLSVRLAAMFLLASIAIVAISALMLRHSLHDSLRKQMHQELQFRHSLMVPYITARNSLTDWSSIATKLANWTTVEGGHTHYWVLSDDPRYQVGGAAPEGIDWAKYPSGFSRIPKEPCSLYLLITDIPANGDRPAVRYAAALDSTPYMGTLNAFTRAMILISIVGVLLVALLGFIVARVGLLPVNHLSQQAHKLAPGNRGQRLATRTLPIELQTLAESFNGVLTRQEVAWNQLESFNANVAHELRTPLTNLIGQTQLGLSRHREQHELEDLLQSNLEELERMTSIVNDMLFLSHAQAGEHALQLSEVSLREEALKTADYLEPSFARKMLTVAIDGDVQARIDRRLFHRALANLLDNSARHAYAASEITVSLKQEDGYAWVCVANIGEPIEAEHLERLFERFYRVDESRSRSNLHHGLGLSIVRAVALMHNGKVFASSDSGINTFGFSLAIEPPVIADPA
ncbi:MAG: heavy metal sensor histidine kinase [Cellvibrio sp.]|uniref:heavy metal sensor histidine kinase n=1 Tax=Cellvibrio sp. TaxID=1965322 RepID=UPI0031B26E6F